MRYNRNHNSGKCAFAAVLLFLGFVCLCFVSYRFLLFLLGAVLIIVGIILIRRC